VWWGDEGEGGEFGTKVEPGGEWAPCGASGSSPGASEDCIPGKGGEWELVNEGLKGSAEGTFVDVMVVGGGDSDDGRKHAEREEAEEATKEATCGVRGRGAGGSFKGGLDLDEAGVAGMGTGDGCESTADGGEVGSGVRDPLLNNE